MKRRKDSEKSGNSELVKEGAGYFNDLKELLPELKGKPADEATESPVSQAMATLCLRRRFAYA